jgi:putative hemolysin
MLATARVLTPSRVLQKIGSMKTALEKFDSEVRLHHYKIRAFEPNITFQFERGNYIVKTAENGAELEACLKLRFEVFHREYMNKKRTIGVDIDKLDYDCDHLTILDKRENRVIGTYRLNSSLFTDTFYSTGEFQMERLLEMEGNKLELGRACIDKDHRNGVVIALLWRGMIEYISRTNTQLLFGCSSVKTMEPLEIGLITKYLIDEGHLTTEGSVTPTRKYKVKQLAPVLEYLESNPFEYNKEETGAKIPSLFRSYLRAGAKIYGEPALDRDFHCADFLTVLKMEELTALYKGKYQK